MCGLSQTVGSHGGAVCVCNCLFCLICTEFCLQGAEGMVVGYCCFLSCCDQTTPHRVSLAITNRPPCLFAGPWIKTLWEWTDWRTDQRWPPKSRFEQINLNEISSSIVHPEWQRATDFQEAEGSILWRTTHQGTIKAILLLLVFLVDQVQIKHKVKTLKLSNSKLQHTVG